MEKNIYIILITAMKIILVEEECDMLKVILVEEKCEMYILLLLIKRVIYFLYWQDVFKQPLLGNHSV